MSTALALQLAVLLSAAGMGHDVAVLDDDLFEARGLSTHITGACAPLDGSPPDMNYCPFLVARVDDWGHADPEYGPPEGWSCTSIPTGKPALQPGDYG